MLLEVFPFNFSVVCCIFGLRLKAEILRGLAFYCLDPQDTWSFWSNCAFGSGSGVALLHPGWFFLDKMCIHQTNMPLKQQGIDGLGTFVKHSEKLLVLWSRRYFTRLSLGGNSFTCVQCKVRKVASAT